jgi:hypothetical protein
MRLHGLHCTDLTNGENENRVDLTGTELLANILPSYTTRSTQPKAGASCVVSPRINYPWQALTVEMVAFIIGRTVSYAL